MALNDLPRLQLLKDGVGGFCLRPPSPPCAARPAVVPDRTLGMEEPGPLESELCSRGFRGSPL